MLSGSKYNDRRERQRQSSARQSFFLTTANTAHVRRLRSTGTPLADTAALCSTGDLPSPPLSNDVPQHHRPIVKTRSLDSGVAMSTMHFNPNNPQDDYGSTGTIMASEKDTPLLIGGPTLMTGRSRSMMPLHHASNSCADLPALDEKPILDVVDRIEDTVEATAYEDLIPLEVKRALENRVFGWTHLTSNILGHTFYTVGSFVLAYLVLSEVHYLFHVHKHHGEPYNFAKGEDDLWFRVTRLALSAFFSLSTFRMVRRRRHVWFRAPYGSKEYQNDAARRRMTVRETDQNTLLGRLMRRGNELMQRRVQKRLMKAHKMFQKKHQQQKQKIKQEQERLLKEQQQKQQQAATEMQITTTTTKEQQDDFCGPASLCYSPCDSFCGNVEDVEHSQTDNSSSGSTSSSDDEAMMAFLQASDTMSSFSDLNPEINHNLHSRRKRRRRTFHTRPTTQTESIMHDQVLLRSGPIRHMPYSHGGFFGAAPFMLANPHWISILRHLLPDVYVEISRRVAYAPASKLIHWAENNPVVAAYGVAHSLEFGINDAPGGTDAATADNTCTNADNTSTNEQRVFTTPNLEWDVFLDPYKVAEVEAVLHERDKFLSSILPMEHYSFYETHKPLGLSLEDWLESINEAAMNSEHIGARIEFTESQRQILKYYADQLEGRAQTMVDKMLIAHGKLTHLIYEQFGLAKRYTFSRVKRTRRTLGGGMYLRHWMAVYAEALKLGLCDDNEIIASFSAGEADVMASIKNVDSYMSTSLNALTEAKFPDSSIAESVATIQSILRRRGDERIDAECPVGIVLDIKSRYISKRVWACAVDTLRAAGVRVVGLASFAVDEIRGISKFCSEPLMEVVFCHSAGDLQRACHNGKIRYGDKVFFNGGSLLWEGTNPEPGCSLGFDPEFTKRNYRILPFGRTRKMHEANRVMLSSKTLTMSPSMTLSSSWSEGSTIEMYKERYGLSIGLYSQEFAIDDAAANLIVELANNNPHVYDLGLSWGGINGLTIKGIQPGRFTSTDGFWNQRYVGARWDVNLYPPPISHSPTMSPQCSSLRDDNDNNSRMAENIMLT
ncbi:expressed unknown protein [Seminavis robusta]|uniref:Uncharacterized protein n=1 Tax=Seminavis robusta TaxID=568900 RepID=A0A9N8EE18_9STRA|nr:expressed unknown protein [Seminavis robusta]|eukprot:Sro865_g212840.1 n/a (1062) ;mRNA; r:22293-25681